MTSKLKAGEDSVVKGRNNSDKGIIPVPADEYVIEALKLSLREVLTDKTNATCPVEVKKELNGQELFKQVKFTVLGTNASSKKLEQRLLFKDFQKAAKMTSEEETIYLFLAFLFPYSYERKQLEKLVTGIINESRLYRILQKLLTANWLAVIEPRPEEGENIPFKYFLLNERKNDWDRAVQSAGSYELLLTTREGSRNASGTSDKILKPHSEESSAEILQLVTRLMKENQELRERIDRPNTSCESYFRDFLELLAKTLPERLPGIEVGYLDQSFDKIPSTKEIRWLEKRVNRVYGLLKSNSSRAPCFNITGDWISQRVCFLAGNFWFVVNEFEKASFHYKQLEQVTPVVFLDERGSAFNIDFLQFNLSYSLSILGKHRESLETSFKILERKPGNYHVLVNIGMALGGLGLFEKALGVFDSALMVDQEGDTAWYGKARALHDLNQREEALFAYDKALTIKPDSYEYLNSKGNALIGLKRFDEAIKVLNKALQIRSNGFKAWVNKGNAFDGLNKHVEAVSSYDKALELYPEDQDVWQYKANTLCKLERFEDAITAYDRALSMESERSATLFNKGYALTRLKRFNEALKLFNEILKEKPGDVETWINKGATLIDLRQLADAEKACLSAIKYKPDDARAWYNLACIQALQGDIHSTIGYLSKTFMLDASFIARVSKDGDFDSIRPKEEFMSFMNGLIAKMHEKHVNTGS
ncbi:MAG: tetratricopeptide repeat protein [Candidatus Odinarchaeota archaeon]